MMTILLRCIKLLDDLNYNLIKHWLNAYNIATSNELKKPKLLKLVRINKEKVLFSYVKIAE
jgi:hypothetical protein